MGSLPKQEPVGLLLGAALRSIKRAVIAGAARHGLSPRQFWVLVAVLEMDSPTLGALAGRLRIDAPTASRVVAALERRRLVRSEPDPADGRLTRLAPGPGAGRLASPVLGLAARIRAAIVSGMPPEEEDAVRRGLLRILGNMEGLARERASRLRRVARGDEA